MGSHCVYICTFGIEEIYVAGGVPPPYGYRGHPLLFEYAILTELIGGMPSHAYGCNKDIIIVHPKRSHFRPPYMSHRMPFITGLSGPLAHTQLCLAWNCPASSGNALKPAQWGTSFHTKTHDDHCTCCVLEYRRNE